MTNADLIAKLRERIGQEFDGECHLTEDEALKIIDRIFSLEKALEPFAAAGDAMSPPYSEYISREGLRRSLTEHDFRKARAVLDQSAREPSDAAQVVGRGPGLPSNPLGKGQT